MINSVLVVVGIVLIAVSFFQCLRIIKINVDTEMRWPWYLLLFLILFFLAGYITYFFLNTKGGNYLINSTLISCILFFGSVFVIGVLTISYVVIKELIDKSAKLDETIVILEKNTEELKKNTEEIYKRREELIKMEELLRDKNAELEKCLDDFYTLRVGIQKKEESDEFEEENKLIKKRLDELKRKV